MSMVTLGTVVNNQQTNMSHSLQYSHGFLIQCNSTAKVTLLDGMPPEIHQHEDVCFGQWTALQVRSCGQREGETEGIGLSTDSERQQYG